MCKPCKEDCTKCPSNMFLHTDTDSKNGKGHCVDKCDSRTEEIGKDSAGNNICKESTKLRLKIDWITKRPL